MVVRRQAKVATDRRKMTAKSKEPVAGTSKAETELVNIGSTSDRSGRDKGVNNEAIAVASTSQQAGDQTHKGLSKAKINMS